MRIHQSLCMLLALVCLIAASSVHAQETTNAHGTDSFDGKWWGNAAKDQKLGFLYALDDCLTSDDSPKLIFNNTWDNYEKLIDRYYAETPKRKPESVESIFKKLGKNQTLSNAAQIGERYGNEFWRSHNDLARLGFIEGYVSCREKIAHSPRWSQSYDYYLSRLNEFFNADDRNGIDAKEYTGSAASAIEMLKD